MALAAQKLSSEPSPVPTPVTVHRVESAADRKAFIQFPYSLYRHDPHWVPPLLMERKAFLNPKKNPWFEFGSVELFLARRNGEVVGRIAAVHDPRYNEFHSTQLGFFGMFECVDDIGVARVLFEAAAASARARGFAQMMGPVNFSTNYECSVLVDGFDSDPYVMMAYNPSYYPALYEASGCQKAKDLWAWELSSKVDPPERVIRAAEMVRKRAGITVRSANMKDFDGEVRRLKEIYNSAWEKNWGFVPMTDREFEHLAKDMKQIVAPELLLIAEVNQEPVAFAMTLPNANTALKAANGRLTTWGMPIGLVRLLKAAKQIKTARLVTLGIKEKFRKRGIDAVLYLDTLRTAKRLGYSGGEISWTLEDNDLINNAIKMMGGKRSKTYRLYQRST